MPIFNLNLFCSIEFLLQSEPIHTKKEEQSLILGSSYSFGVARQPTAKEKEKLDTDQY